MFDRIYTIGCFDYFHYGHQNLLDRMRKYGKIIIVGIHDDASIEKLKNLKPIDHEPLETRIKNVKKYADAIFVIPDCDPSLYIECMLRNDDNKSNACFIRGDDMPNFPGKEVVDEKISIKFLSYTYGISSTEIRKNLNN